MKPGGTIVYSVCTFTAEECESIVEFGVRECNLRLVPQEPLLGSPGLEQLKSARYANDSFLILTKLVISSLSLYAEKGCLIPKVLGKKIELVEDSRYREKDHSTLLVSSMKTGSGL